MTDSHEADILIAGVGHPLMGDDALGLEVLRKIEEDAMLPRTRLFYAGSAPVDILGELSGVKKLIVIDALQGVPPGAIIKQHFSPTIPALEINEVETHGIGLVQTLCLAHELMPDIDIIIIGVGTEPMATPGLPLRQSLHEQIPALIRIIKDEVAVSLTRI